MVVWRVYRHTDCCFMIFIDSLCVFYWIFTYYRPPLWICLLCVARANLASGGVVKLYRHAWLHTPQCRRSMQQLFETLGLEPTATLAEIKAAYRCLAKKFHPDRNRSSEATALFQQLNHAYNILTNLGAIPDTERANNQQGDNKLCHISLSTKENTFSVTIDIVDFMFLVFVEECKVYHGVSPIDRGQHGLLFYFAYTSPNDSETYGSISLTFYPTTARLLVQGSSYLLWIDEHMPMIYARAEYKYMENASKWNDATKRLGIGLRRSTETRRLTRASAKAQGTALVNSQTPSKRVPPAGLGATITAQPAVSGSIASADVPPIRDATLPGAAALVALPGTDGATTDAPDATAHTVSDATALAPAVPNGNVSDVPCMFGATVPTLPDATALVAPPGPDGAASDVPSMTNATISIASDVTACRTHATSTGAAKATKKKQHKGARTKTKSRGKKQVPSAVDGNVRYCKDTCEMPAVTTEPMIRCTLCMTWHHNTCVGEASEYVGAWTCDTCRTLPLQVKSLSDKMNDLATSLSNRAETEKSLQQEIRKLMSENSNLKQKLTNAEQRNSELQKLINTMCYQQDTSVPDKSENVSQPQERETPWVTVPTQNRFTVLSSVSDTTGTGTPSHTRAPSPRRRHSGGGHGGRSSVVNKPQKTASQHRVTSSPQRTTKPVMPPSGTTVTIIGSSIVRGVAPMVQGRGFQATGYVYPGHTARQINAHIRHIPADSDVTVIAAGTNNVQQQSVPECVAEIKQVIDNVARKRRDKHVIMSALPYRYDQPSLNTKVDTINSVIADQVKKRNRWHLLRHELSHRDYKPDGLHFNISGVAKYAHEIRCITRRIKSR